MSDNALTVLKFCLMALLYLFLARVVWLVASELRASRVPAAPPPEPDKPERADGAGAKGKTWQLRVVAPAPVAGQAFPVTAEMTIGRAPGCAIRFADDTFVSSLHARVYLRDGSVFVEDLGSTNGTTVNGGQVSGAVRLRKGDRLQVGDHVLEARR